MKRPGSAIPARRRRPHRLAAFALLALGVLGLTTTAWAFWTSAGNGTGSATVATLNPPSTPTLSHTTGTQSVAIAWTAPSGLVPDGYTITRVRSDNVTAPACGSSPTTLVTSPCTDTLVPAGTYRYVVTAVYRSWTATSPTSAAVTVVPDTAAPVVTVTHVNGASRAFPFRTNVNVTSIGGACGMVSGDATTVQPRIDGSGTTPPNANCLSGSWSLTLTTPITPAGTITVSATQADAVGNIGTAPAQAVTIDRTPPTVTSIVRSGANQSVNVLPLTWTVTFSEQVTGVAAGRFAVQPIGVGGTAPTVAAVSPASTALSATWTVTTNQPAATGTHATTIGLNLSSIGAVADAAGNPLTATLPFVGGTYTFDTARPTVSSIVRAGAASVVNAGPLSWTVTLAEPVNGLTAANLTLATSGISGAAPTITSVTPNGAAPVAVWTVTASTSGTSGADAATIGLNLSSTTGITDPAGNLLNVTVPFTGATYTYDNTRPTVTSVSSDTGNGTYRAGQVIDLKVTFSEAVNVAGTPQLALATGSPATPASYLSGSGTITLVFRYTVAAGNTSSDLDYASTAALTLNGGSIADPATNPATLTLPAPGAANSLGANEAFVIDTTAPVVAITSVAGSTTFPYATNGTITSLAGTCGALLGDLTPITVQVNNGSTTTTLTPTCSAGAWTVNPNLSASATYTITASQSDAVGNLGTSASRTVTVDKVAPTVTGVSSPLADGAYRTGQPVPVTLAFSEPVIVTGSPTLSLRTTASASTAVPYTSGSGTNTLTFTYTVAAGNASSDLDYFASTALALNGGTIRDAVTNNATLTLAAPGASGSLGASKNLVIDTTAPTVSSVTSGLANGSYRAGQVIDVTVTFTEPVNVTGTPQLALATGTPATPAYYLSGSGGSTLTFRYTVAAGNNSADLDYASTAALTLNGGTIADAATNPATLTLPPPGTTSSLGFNKALVIDTTPPVVTVSDITPLWILGVRVNGQAEAGSGTVTVYLCDGVATCDATSATTVLTDSTLTATGAWQTGWAWLGSGDWYATATQTDAAGNIGTSAVFGPVSN